MNFLFTNNLTAIEYHISKTIYANAEEVLNMSIMDVARLCNVSSSKITKYSVKLGFDGYKELRYELKKALNEQPVVLSDVDTQLSNLQNFIASIDLTHIDSVIEVIEDYNDIILYGNDDLNQITGYFAERLKIVSEKNVYNYTNINYLKEALKSRKTHHLLIMLSSDTNSEEYLDLIKNAYTNSNTIILITDELTFNPSILLTINLLSVDRRNDDHKFPNRTPYFMFLELIVQKFLVR